MIFSTFFEVSLVVLGFLYIANEIFSNVITLIEIGKDIEEKEKEKEEDKAREELTKHLYS